MKTSLDIRSIKEVIADFFRRFHTLLFFLIVSGGLFVAILTLLNIISVSSSVAPDSSDAISGEFDQATIERVSNLGGRSASQPGNRASPFVE